MHVWALVPELVRVATERQTELTAMRGQGHTIDDTVATAPAWARTCPRMGVPQMLKSRAMYLLGSGTNQDFNPELVTLKHHTEFETIDETVRATEASSVSFPDDLRSVTPLQQQASKHCSSSPTLHHERSVLKSRQRRQETTIAVRISAHRGRLDDTRGTFYLGLCRSKTCVQDLPLWAYSRSA